MNSPAAYLNYLLYYNTIRFHKFPERSGSTPHTVLPHFTCLAKVPCSWGIG